LGFVPEKLNTTDNLENRITIDKLTQADKDYIYKKYRDDFVMFNYPK
jgi:hypothetical protein